MDALKKLLIIPVAALFILLAGCAGKATIKEKLNHTLSGSAYDAVRNNTERYIGAGRAIDGLTQAQSFTASSAELSASVHAECTDPSSNQLDSDQARASSNNQVNTKFTITKIGDLTFHINLKIKGEEIVHGDSILIRVMANILTKTGTGIPEGGITNTSLVIKPNPTGNDTVYIAKFLNKDNSVSHEKATVDQNGNFDFSFPASIDGHDNLSPGDYQLEFVIRLNAYAEAKTGANGKKFKAKVNKVTGTIKLR